MTDVIVKAKLIAYNQDLFGYTTLAFQNTDTNEYILCVKFPNWQQSPMHIGDIGILHFREVIAGEDKWYDKDGQYIPYNYSGWHFIKFIKIEQVDDMIMN